jgi:hypothetical protein
VIRRTLAFAGITIVGLGLSGAAAGAAPDQARDDNRARRVLLFSLPYVSWEQLDRVDLPNIDKFVRSAAIADLATRGSGRSTRLVDGYLTISAGGRAYGVQLSDGEQFAVDEKFGDTTAGEAFEQRTNQHVEDGIVSLGIVAIREANRASDFDTDLGAFADALTNRIKRAVIANADGAQPDVPPIPTADRYRRAAALALVGTEGTVPGGRVDAGLLAPERGPRANEPFGHHLDQSKVVDAFRDVWTGRAVVLVEASDLVLAQAYRPVAEVSQRDRQLDQALRRTDRLLGELLSQVDTSRDAVLLLNPTPPGGTDTLTVAALQGPGVEPGLLRSGTTRRDGFVQLIDVAPAVLDMLGVERPTKMEGRPFDTVDDSGRSVRERRDFLIDQAAASDFRDARIREVQITIVVTTGLLALLAAWSFSAGGRWVPSRQLVARFALWVLAFPTATFLVRLFPLHDVGALAYWPVLIAVTFGAAWLFERLGGDRPFDALLIALLTMVGVLVIDTLVGTPLQFNSPLGPSPSASRRFGGLTNTAYACLAAAAVLAAPLLARRVGGRRGVAFGIGLLAVVLVVDGAPFWGSDVGGILSLTPAFAFMAVVMLGRKVRLRTVAWCAAALVAGITLVAFIDMSRASENRSHLGRLIERVQDNGIGDLFAVIERKLSSNLRTFTASFLGIVLPIVLLFFVWLWRTQRPRIEGVLRALPEWRAACLGFAVVALLGWALNDSGIAIPGVMLAIFTASVVWLLERADDTTTKPQKSMAKRSSARAAPAKASR